MLNTILLIRNDIKKVEPFTVCGTLFLNSLLNIELYLKSRYKSRYTVGTESYDLLKVFKTKKPDFELKSSFSRAGGRI